MAYTDTLISVVGGPIPRFDLILLGMGPDGHTASLFPGSPLLESQDIVAVVHNSPKPPPVRLTLTFSVINNAKNIVFLVAGADKAQMLRQVLDPSTSNQFPAGRVDPRNGKLSWLIDESAAQQLT